jgi:hypothetical protein
MLFSNWLFNQLPPTFKEEDTYPDINGEGLLERFLRIFGDELDTEVIPQIEDYLDIRVPGDSPSNGLVLHLAYSLGNPPNLFGSNLQYRRLLGVIIAIYKIKGTLKGLQILGNLFGITLSIQPLGTSCPKYDMNVLYDDGALYDNCCRPCHYYNLLWSPHPCIGPIPSPYSLGATAAQLRLMERILCFMMPMHAKQVDTIQTVFVCDEANLDITEEVVVIVTKLNQYDALYEYDTPLEYDNGNAITIYV